MKTNTNRAILIDATNQTITEVAINKAEALKDYYKLMDCRTITTGTYLPNGDCIYVDDEGLFGGDGSFFEVKGAHQPFAGNAVIVGTNNATGNTISAKSKLEDVKALISFVDINTLRRRYA